MGNAERLLDFVDRFPGRDDDEISRALGIKPRQVVNQLCRRLAGQGKIDRRTGLSGKLGNFPNTAMQGQSVAIEATPPITMSPSDPTDWFWEGNVTSSLRRVLEEDGWVVLAHANTATKERGVDLHVRRYGEELLIEVKGYPSAKYRDPMRAMELKPTQPTNQASQWYSHALLKAVRLRSAHPHGRAAMAFPDFPRYRTLHAETAGALQLLNVATFFLASDGTVERM